MELLKLPSFFASWLLILVFVLHCCSGCVENERIALVEIKSSYVAWEHINRKSVILSWNQSIDCCSWPGVHCSPTTKHVTGLELRNAYSTYGTNRRPLNFSLFLPFTELQSLSLRDNDIRICIPKTDCFGSLAGLKKLKYLDLSYNYFDGKVLSSFPASSSLKVLGLAGNNLTSEKFITASDALSRLSKIKNLDLSYNYFDTSIVPNLALLSSLKTLILSGSKMKGRLSLEEFSKLDKLELSDLRMNELYGDIPLMSNEWTSLKGLSIKYNQLNGTSLEGLCMMKNLEELDISFNNLNSDIPDCFRYLSSLNYLDISHNQLETRFPSSIFENLTRLEFAAFSDNNFNGVLSVSSFANNAQLKLLDLSNNYQLELETEDLVSPPLFQLEGIALTNCIVNKVSQSIPTFLSSQYMIEYIDLSSNNLKGNIPLWLLENKTNLTNLNLRDNSLTGSLILPSQSTNLELLDVSNNKLTGEIPLSIGTIFPNLWYLNMSNNLLQGVIPPSVKNLSDLEYFDLSDNNLSGQFSNLLKELPNLYILDLSMNQFQGTLTPNNMTQFSLSCFLVNNNQLSGEIPTSLCDMPMLSFLDISENHFFGNLPSCITGILRLSVLNAAGNNLEGNLPNELCHMNQLESMDLSKNHFFGQVPSCFNMTHLEYLNLRDNELTGPFPNALSNLPLVTLDLGNNHFFGHIPSWIGTTLRVCLVDGKVDGKW
ncbi:Non-specific serine/threonine protein kinase protein [Dioscorea alata]|uniref:Non-specific serine/threonine protein kinase protein n=1 Tax=Dioscorea alata TaxID=55571 RepID=A0ACB7WJH0_DIOAL|nr:Non-specific serine/threonine protein kinase protein [Dioscorea alata]